MHNLQTLALLLTFSRIASTAWADAPELKCFFPPGGQRGQTVEVRAEGNGGQVPRVAGRSVD
jgi:hypothetical protein